MLRQVKVDKKGIRLSTGLVQKENTHTHIRGKRRIGRRVAESDC